MSNKLEHEVKEEILLPILVQMKYFSYVNNLLCYVYFTNSLFHELLRLITTVI